MWAPVERYNHSGLKDLKLLPMEKLDMTKQEIFDTVCTHLAKQQRRAWDEVQNGCSYKNDKGDMCAVGCLFNDEELRAVGNSGTYITKVVRDHESALRPFFKEHVGFLRSLQRVHDESTRKHAGAAAGLRLRLCELATTHHLNPEAAAQIQVWNG